MRNLFITSIAACAASLALTAAAQTSSSGSSSTYPTPGQPGYESGRHFGATGRMGHHEVRASKIIGADVKSNQGQSLGTINDVIFNPASGRIDFAVISYSGPTGSESTSGTSTSATSTPGTSSSTTTPGATSSSTTTPSPGSLTAGKLVAVPWMLLRPSSASGYGATTSPSTTTTGTTGGQETFMFSGDSSKLQSAPSFDQSNWPDITQPSWRQSIYAHFGMTPGSAMGGATSPGGTESSGGSSTTTTPPTPPSSSSGNSSSDSSKPQ